MDILSDLVEGPKLAPIGQRFLAALVDAAILGTVWYVIFHYFGHAYKTYSYTGGDTTPEVSTGVSVTGWPAFFLFVTFVLYLMILEGATGQTLGMRLVRIQVIRDNKEPGSIGTSIARHLFDIVDVFFLIGLIVASANPKRQRVGDLVARTVVVMKE